MPIPDLEMRSTTTNWGVQLPESLVAREPKCWRCLKATVPEDDELGLCDPCIAVLQDPPRSSHSLSSPSTTPRA
jgi:hypothetical protein